MKIFKFGGASVKNAAGVKNILNVLHYTGYEKTLIVVSAMGKTTNALEQVVQSFFDNKEMYPQDLEQGVIHTDFEKGFIRAEVISFNDYIKLGSEQKVKEAGKMRIEGKEYIVKDGDVMHFRFNL